MNGKTGKTGRFVKNDQRRRQGGSLRRTEEKEKNAS